MIRHGETQWNRQKRIQGHGDSPLTLKGVRQAEAYGRALPALMQGRDWRLICSPLPRCMQTMSIICDAAGLDFGAVERDARITEVHTGDYSGRLKAEFPAGELAGTGRGSWLFNCPGGETWSHLRDRLAAWLADLSDAETVIAVSHGIAGKVLRGLYAGWDADFALAQDSPQDAVFKLCAGRVERISCP